MTMLKDIISPKFWTIRSNGVVYEVIDGNEELVATINTNNPCWQANATLLRHAIVLAYVSDLQEQLQEDYNQLTAFVAQKK